MIAASTIHPHEPEIAPTYDTEGRCLVCALLAAVARERELRGRVEKELLALEGWAAEQNAGNAFADQVRLWAVSKRAALRQEAE